MSAEDKGRTTPEQNKGYARRAAQRVGAELVVTLRLFDEDPVEYRQLMLDAFDKEVVQSA